MAALALPGPAPAADPAAPAPGAYPYPLESYSAIGSTFAQNRRLPDLGWDEVQLEAFLEGVRAACRGKPYAPDDRSRALYEDIMRRLQQVTELEARARREFFADPARLEAYMKEASKTYHLERFGSGLAFGLLVIGSGARPGPDDTVVISYRVQTADAQTELPQLGVKHKRVKVAGLVPGLKESIQMMAQGSTATLILPPDLWVGQEDWPAGTERGVPLIFTVNLHEIISAR